MNKWFLLAIFTVTIAMNGFSNDVIGGEITWNCQPDGKFVFTVATYAYCDSNAVATPASIDINTNAISGNINCIKVNTLEMVNPCYASINAFACGLDSAAFMVKKDVYRSAPIQLGGIPPASGWYFDYSICCRNANNFANSNQGLYLRAAMFPYTKNGSALNTNLCYDASPQFDEKPLMYFEQGLDHEIVTSYLYDTDADSIKVEWDTPRGAGPYPGTAIVYDTNFSTQYPLPTASSSTGSYMRVLNEKTGSLAFKSFTLGTFNTSLKVISFRNNQKISEVYRELPYFMVSDFYNAGICPGVSNLGPDVEVNKAPWSKPNLEAVLNLSNDTVFYKSNVFPGDTISLNITGLDNDFKENCNFQNITFSAQGLALDSSLYNARLGIFNSTLSAHITSLNTSGSFEAPIQNRVNFKWVIDTTHLLGALQQSFQFNFNFKDDNCSWLAETQIPLVVQINRPLKTNQSNVGLCVGDSIQVNITGDTTNILWTPSIGVSNVNSAKPWFKPAVTTVYTVTDLNSGYSENVNIEVGTATTPHVVVTNNALELANTANWDTIVWKLNGAPYTDGYSSLVPFLSGTYYLDGIEGPCEVLSNGIDSSFANNFSLNPMGQFLQQSSFNSEASYGINFKSFASSDLYVESIVLSAQVNNVPDLPQIIFDVYDDNQNKLFSSDSIQLINNNLLRINGGFTLEPGNNYFVRLYSDGTRIVNLYQPTNWPVQDLGKNLIVFNASQNPGKVSFPASMANHYPYLHFMVDGNIGLQEEALKNAFKMFPNPANGTVNFNLKGDYTLRNNLGQVLKMVKNSNQMDLSQLNAGVYFVEFLGMVKKLIIQ